MGWMHKDGGYHDLSEDDKTAAEGAHAKWQQRDPEQHSSGVADYVSYVQNATKNEVAGFVNRQNISQTNWE